MALIESCAAVSTDFATWFPCLLDTLFLGNPVLAEIMFFIVFGLVAWKANLPAEFVLPISTLFTVGLFLVSGSSSLLLVLELAIVLAAGWMAYVLVKKVFGE